MMDVNIDQAARFLKEGQVVAVPTETVYGLAASLYCPEAIQAIFKLKGRPSNNPLIIHVASVDQIRAFVKDLPPHFEFLSESFWPGPLTVILPIIEEKIPKKVTAGLSTGAFRIPKHSLVMELIHKVGPLVMPSANLSGKPSATCVKHIQEDFGEHLYILDGGQCLKGVESTILSWVDTEWKIARLGALSPEDICAVLGYLPVVSESVGSFEAPICPGQLYRHYSPKARLILLNEVFQNVEGAIVGFEDRVYPPNCRLFSLGSSSNVEDAARELYRVLRHLDEEKIEEAVVDMNFPFVGLWRTLRARLLKAAQS